MLNLVAILLSYTIPDGDSLSGALHANKMKLVEAWIEIHKEELMANRQLAVGGQSVY